MIKNIAILTIFFTMFVNAQETSSSLTRQKLEVLELKKEFQNFYDEKETFDKMVHMIEDRQQEVSLNTTNFFTDEYFMEIFNTFPDVAKKFKTWFWCKNVFCVI